MRWEVKQGHMFKINLGTKTPSRKDHGQSMFEGTRDFVAMFSSIGGSHSNRAWHRGQHHVFDFSRLKYHVH